jgi:hypothetical protein
MKKINLLFILLSFVLTLNVHAETAVSGTVSAAPGFIVGDHEFSVMTYNVENLFDTIHDKGTEDYPTLPLAEKKKSKEVQKFCAGVKNSYYQKECFEQDWNKDVLEVKLNNLAEVIQSVNNGQGADNMLMAEVENLRVLKMLVNGKLKKLGYKTVVLIEGPDTRGIDPAFVSKFPQVGKAKLHLIPYQDDNADRLKIAKKSRGILEVTVRAPNKKNITFLSAHFPSQANPTEWRAQAIQFAKGLMAQYQKEGRAVIFGGDLNIIATEETENGYFSQEMSAVGDVSHLVGCKSCQGSHNYKGEWSFLDVLVYSKNLKDLGFELLPASIQIVKTTVNSKDNGTPLRFDEEKKTGASDHFPLFSVIKYK